MADTLPLNTSLFTQGFGSYLTGILPNDIAIACGAFSASMRQIRNINNVPIEKFAQVVTNIETTNGLNLVNGTNIPTDSSLSTAGAALVALGSGPSGTYTMSDFFGAMSGLPYPLVDIQDNITTLQTSTLTSIYQQLYLAVSWEGSTGHITVTYSHENVQPYIAPNLPTDPGQPRIDNWFYTITGVITDNHGGGYSRGGTAAPTVTISPNSASASFHSVIDTNDANIPTTYGRVNLIMDSAGSRVLYNTTSVMQASLPAQPAATIPTVSVQTPPIGVMSSVGSNQTTGTTGWPNPMNNVVQTYIDAANAEISHIKINNPVAAKRLNILWNIIGTQLTTEQRARVTAIPAVPVPQDTTLSQYPMSIMSFVDSIPNFAINTLPHMYAQTMEAISDWKNTGGQSIVGMMRQERNQTRLLQAGIELDNNMAGTMTPTTAKLLAANGTVSVATAGIPIDNAIFTIPANLSQTDGTGALVVPMPVGVFDTTQDGIVIPSSFVESDVLGTLPDLLNNSVTVNPGSDEAGFDPIANDDGQNANLVNPIANNIPNGPSTSLDVGKANVPGSLAGSPYQNIIPPELQVSYSASTLTPSTYSVPDAIDQVIHCNCDCWVQ